MTADEIETLRVSLRKCMRRKTDIADVFYANLFALAPQTRPLFGPDIEAQTEKTMLALGVIVSQIHDIEAFGPMVAELAQRHVDYGVGPHHYALVGEALHRTLRAVFGDELSAQEAHAWRLAYDTMADVMIAAAYPPQASERVEEAEAAI